MKKTVGFITTVLLFVACHSDNDMKYKNSDGKDVDVENTQTPVGIQNVNGNIPDTTNTIDIGTNEKYSVK